MIGKTFSQFGIRILVVSLMFLVVACEANTPMEPPASPTVPSFDTPIRVSTSTDFIADWVTQVGGDRVIVTSLLPSGGTPHHYHPSPQDIVLVSESDLFFQVGLGLEAEWVAEIIAETPGEHAKIVLLGDFVEVLAADPDESALEHPDPIFWLDPLQVQSAVSAIATQLSELDPTQAEFFQEQAASYNSDLEELHSWILTQVESIPEKNRGIVTEQSFMQYFAQRYGLEIVETVTEDESAGHSHEAPAQHLAELVVLIQELEIKAIFTVFSDPIGLADNIGDEAGVQSIVPLYGGSLGSTGTGADSYIGMMRSNVESLVKALK